MDVSVIIVNFHSEKFLTACLESISKNFAKKSYEIIIVNNDNSPLDNILALQFSNIHIENSPANSGFAKACNLGAKIAQGETLFFLNPDTQIISPLDDLFSQLTAAKVGIVAPSLILPTGENQPWSVGSALNFWGLLKNNFGFNAGKKMWQSKEIQEVGWVSGAALAIANKLFVSLGGFDEKFFMYFEDIDLCLRAQQNGYQVLRLPQFSVLHVGGQSYNDSSVQKKHYYQSQDYYFRKHFGLASSLAIQILRKLFLSFKKS